MPTSGIHLHRHEYGCMLAHSGRDTCTIVSGHYFLDGLTPASGVMIANKRCQQDLIPRWNHKEDSFKSVLVVGTLLFLMFAGLAPLSGPPQPLLCCQALPIFLLLLLSIWALQLFSSLISPSAESDSSHRKGSVFKQLRSD